VLHRIFTVTLLLIACARPVAADDWTVVRPRAPQPSLFEPDSTVRTFGVSVIAGIPSGIAPSLSVHPFHSNLLHVDLGPSGALAFGVRGGVTVDPFDWVVAPTLTVEASYFGWADIPGIQGARFDMASVGVLAGVEIGRRSRWRIFVRGGYAHMWGGTRGLTDRYAVALDTPRYTLDPLPALELGLTAFL
jgi:hypothetical protein